MWFFPGPTFWRAGELVKGKDPCLHYPSAKVALDLSQTLTIKRKITDEPAWVIVARNFQELKELPSVFSQLSFFLTSRDWSFAFKENHAQHERILSGSNVGSLRKTRGTGFNNQKGPLWWFPVGLLLAYGLYMAPKHQLEERRKETKLRREAPCYTNLFLISTGVTLRTDLLLPHHQG